MNKFDLKKQTITEDIAKYILLNGVKNASLRNTAEALSTSNRMLLHYFKDKEEMMTETLFYIMNSFISMIENTNPQKMVFKDLIPYIYKTLEISEIKPYTQLFLELISLSAKKEEPYYSVARKLGDIFYNWIEKIVIIEDNQNREEQTALIFVIMEGFVVLNALNCNDKIEKAIKKISD